MAKRTVSLDEVPLHLRDKARNDFITGLLELELTAKQSESDLYSQIATHQLKECIAEMRDFHKAHFGPVPAGSNGWGTS